MPLGSVDPSLAASMSVVGQLQDIRTMVPDPWVFLNTNVGDSGWSFVSVFQEALTKYVPVMIGISIVFYLIKRVSAR